MKAKKRLVALSCVLFLIAACGGTPPTTAELENQAFEDLREEVRQTIEDSNRQAAVVAVIDQLHDEFTSLRRLAEERRARIRELNADYDATREQFAAMVNEFNAQREAKHKRFQNVQDSLRSSVTPEEWADLEKTNTKAMASLARLIAAI